LMTGSDAASPCAWTSGHGGNLRNCLTREAAELGGPPGWRNPPPHPREAGAVKTVLSHQGEAVTWEVPSRPRPDLQRFQVNRACGVGYWQPLPVTHAQLPSRVRGAEGFPTVGNSPLPVAQGGPWHLAAAGHRGAGPTGGTDAAEGLAGFPPSGAGHRGQGPGRAILGLFGLESDAVASPKVAPLVAPRLQENRGNCHLGPRS